MEMLAQDFKWGIDSYSLQENYVIMQKSGVVLRYLDWYSSFSAQCFFFLLLFGQYFTIGHHAAISHLLILIFVKRNQDVDMCV